MFELVSSHNEAISFNFAQFLHSDTIIEFTYENTEWLQVSVKDKGQIFGSFNILFDQFQDNKRKECQVDFEVNLNRSDQQIINVCKEAYIYYEGQLITNELQYFEELQKINQEDKEEAQDFKSQFEDIKIKLTDLIQGVNRDDRVETRKKSHINFNNQHLSVEDKLKLSKKGTGHATLRASYVISTVKGSMVPMESEGNKFITDRYIVHPLVEDGKFSNCCFSTEKQFLIYIRFLNNQN